MHVAVKDLKSSCTTVFGASGNRNVELDGLRVFRLIVAISLMESL